MGHFVSPSVTVTCHLTLNNPLKIRSSVLYLRGVPLCNTNQFTTLQYSEVYFLSERRGHICCTLRSGLHEIPTVIRTFSHGLKNNHAYKWTFDNFPVMLTYELFLENCQKSICMHGCSPIHVERS